MAAKKYNGIPGSFDDDSASSSNQFVICVFSTMDKLMSNTVECPS